MPFFPTDIENRSLLPFEEGEVDGYLLPLSLDSLLIESPASTFFARLSGSRRDLIIIDRSAEVVDGSLVVIFIEGEFLLKRVEITADGGVMLSVADSAPIPLPEGTEIWGRAVYYIKGL